MKLRRIAALLLLAGVVNAPAVDARGFTVGIMAGESNLDEFAAVACSDLSYGPANFFGSATCLTGDDDLAYGFNLGYHLTDVIGLEGGYVNLGESSFTTVSPLIDVPFGFPPPLETTVFSTNVVYGAVVGTLPLGDRLSLSGRAGLYEASIDVEIDDGFGFRQFELESTNDSYFGASLNYQVIRNLNFQLRYDDFDVEVTSVGLTYTF